MVERTRQRALRNAKRRKILEILFAAGITFYLTYTFFTQTDSIIHGIMPIGMFCGLGMLVWGIRDYINDYKGEK